MNASARWFRDQTERERDSKRYRRYESRLRIKEIQTIMTVLKKIEAIEYPVRRSA